MGTYDTLEDMLDLSADVDRDIFKSINFERDWLKNKFKSLHPQPKQKWSEEDEEALRELLNILFRRDVEVSDDTEWLSFKLKKWCKDLRPHWKPSEEQMDALETAVSSLQSSALESLHEDLQKLIKI